MPATHMEPSSTATANVRPLIKALLILQEHQKDRQMAANHANDSPRVIKLPPFYEVGETDDEDDNTYGYRRASQVSGSSLKQFCLRMSSSQGRR